MITEKQMKIVDAVAELGCEEIELLNRRCLTHVVRATGLNRIHNEGFLNFATIFRENKYWECICTIEEYNQCIEEMKYHYDIPKWCSYNRADKELLTVENSDYSFYEKETLVYGQDVYVNNTVYSNKKFKFGCLTLDGESAIILCDSGVGYVSLSEVSSKPIKSKKDIELEEAKLAQLNMLLENHSGKFLHPNQFKLAIAEMQKNGDLALIKLTEEE